MSEKEFEFTDKLGDILLKGSKYVTYCIIDEEQYRCVIIPSLELFNSGNYGCIELPMIHAVTIDMISKRNVEEGVSLLLNDGEFFNIIGIKIKIEKVLLNNDSIDLVCKTQKYRYLKSFNCF